MESKRIKSKEDIILEDIFNLKRLFYVEGESLENSYEIKLDFEKDSNAVNVFATLMELQHGLDQYNKTLIGAISSDIKISSVLLDVESGSIKTSLQDFIKKLPDDEMIERFIDKPKDVVKEGIKEILKKGRAKLFKIAEIPDLSQKEKENLLVDETKEIIEKSDLSAYGMKVSKEKIVKAAEEVYKPIRESKNDIYIDQDGNGFKKLNKSFKVDIEETFKDRTVENIFRAKVIIKKPVFVGTSKWEVIYDKSMEVEMKDSIFINRIKNREIAIRAGDRLDCQFKSVIVYNDDYEVIESRYYILEVYGVIPPLDEQLII
ncbi:hypothetical protein [Halarcobacter sp.]|uniref:hypothetical protein n=1 Tax=Halarcobacter sp. TaxID=2321133 RepID=UPI003A93C162